MDGPVAADPVAALARDVFQKRMIGIAEEMSSALRRAAYSSIIWDMYDYSCAVLTPAGELLAQAETIPAQLGVIETACAHVARKVPISSWEEGDIIICNDPYQGCTHTPDIVLFSPVFVGGDLVALTSTIAHHVDLGGKTPCTTAPDNTEVFGEGVIFPPMKLLKAGKPVDEIFVLLANNVRNPEACAGDLRAQIAGCRTAERRLRDVVQGYGPERFAELTRNVLDYGENYVRMALRQFPNGESSAVVRIEDGVASSEPMTVACRVRLTDDAIEVDFAGTSPQRPHGLNCPFSSTISMVNYAVKAAMSPGIPQNGGCSRPVRILCEEGTILNPRRPAAVGSRHFTQQAVAEAVLIALRPFVGETGYAGSQISFPSLKIGGFDTRSERSGPEGMAPYFTVTDIMGGGGGATHAGDGLDGIDTHGSNCAILSAEIMELVCPVRVLRTELVAASGGDGEFRGGLGMRREYELLCDGLNVNVYVQQQSDYNRSWGSAGGGESSSARAALDVGGPGERALPPKSIGLSPPAGTRILLEGAGGGGYGDPARRGAAARERDRQEKYV
ncbi:hydantoinase B/oxoprolinase family protein [Afifella sp. IM 167]|uniref:hydantoinase B/oxoprolinase family protein n=1 Tax=Afifella sp. IM 167 TaxID=2033586 RepID=UPI001CC99504|nr:hydantoinase B/oxoprolinase family protein [Afifella sp. IM 167]